MKYLLVTLSLITIYSCSQINVESRKEFAEKKESHGIVPLKILTTVGPYSSSLKYDEKIARRGKKLFINNCAKCHGPDAKGKNGSANLVKKLKSFPNFQFFISVSQWKNEMPGWKDKKELTEKELNDITHYLKKLAAN
jgi:cytochrome c553